MILHIGRVILVIFEVLVIFNLLIVVHEIGHFLAARWRGLYVEKFGVWFGKPLWKKKIDGVQYSLGSLPFGGFVALPKLAPMDIIEGKADVDRAHLPPVSALDKIIVAVAGPFFSLLLAIVFAAIVWIVGYPVSESDTTTVVGYIMPDSPAEKVGLRPGDIIRGFNHTPIYNPVALLEYIKKHPDETLALEVERSGSRFEVPVKPVPLPTDGKMQPRIGIQWDTSGQMSIAHPNPVELVHNSVTSTFNTLGAVASPKSDIKLQHLSGPIGIGRIYYLFFVSERGWQLALWLSVVLNVNLAILNMLPIPVLDGGHILFGLIESIRRKPLNMRVLEVVQGVCTVLIIGAIAYISFFDVQDLPFVKSVLDKYAPQSQTKDRDLP